MDSHWSGVLLHPKMEPELEAWLTKHDPVTAFARCDRPDWLLSLLFHSGADRSLLVCALCDCARLSLDLLPEREERPRRLLDTLSAWAHRRARPAEVVAAAEVMADLAEDRAPRIAREVAGALRDLAEVIDGRWQRAIGTPRRLADAIASARSADADDLDGTPQASGRSGALPRVYQQMCQQIRAYRWPLKGNAAGLRACRPQLAVAWDRVVDRGLVFDLPPTAALVASVFAPALCALVPRPNNAERSVIRAVAEQCAADPDPDGLFGAVCAIASSHRRALEGG